MFAKQRAAAKIPRVRGLRVGDMLLSDAKWLRESTFSEKQLEPIREAWSRLQSYVTSQREGTKVCANDRGVKDLYDAAFAEFKITAPKATTDDFDLVYDPVYDDTDVDPRLGSLTLTVQQDDVGFVGLFHLYNVRRELDDDDFLVINASPSPSFTTTRGYLDPDDLGKLMKALLENDLEIEGGFRKLDIIEWRLPTRDSHAWVEKSGGDLTHRALAHLSTHDRTEKGEVPEKIRRKHVGIS